MKYLAFLLLLVGHTAAAIVVNGPCPQTAGTLTSPVTITRASGISPLLVFFDNTAVTSTHVTTTAFQDVNSTWDFGDTLTSGTSTWRFGANPNHNLRRFDIGNITAHLYVTQGRDTKYTATVTSKDGVNTVSCGIGVTVFDPSGANGWPGAATTCLFNTTVGGGCPAGATQTVASTSAATNANLSNKRLLYKCGDTFTGGGNTASGTKWSIGAYGGCEGTQTNRPIFSNTAANYHLTIANTSVDFRVSDIDLEGNGSPNGAITLPMNVLSTSVVPTQGTLYNLKSNGNGGAYIWGQATQFGLIDSEGFAKAGTGNIAIFVNVNQNNCVNTSTAYNCGGTPSFLNVNYNAMLGDNSQGVGGAGGNVESTRVGACRLCVFNHNLFDNAIGNASNFKYTDANTFNTQLAFLGQFNELNEISDNNFGAAASGYEVAPENAGTDERIRLTVVERNIETMPTTSSGTRMGMFSGQNMTLRDNVFVMNTSGGNYPQTGTQTGSRGACQLTATCGGTAPAFLPTGNEIYNNTCYSPTGHAGQNCIENDTGGSWGAPASSSFFQNNMLYVGTGSGYTTVTNTGSGNTVSNNTTSGNTSVSPAFTNGSGLFNVLTDFKPTANFSGGTTVPVQYDALGVLWPPTWSLGAVHP